jgi:hypothetical protein
MSLSLPPGDTMRIRSACVGAVVTMCLAALAVACSPEATGPSEVDPTRVALDKKVDELQARYGWIGKYHTDGLDYVFGELSRKGGKRDKKTLCSQAAIAMQAFHRSARGREIPFDQVDPTILAGECGDQPSKGGSANITVEGAGQAAAIDASSLVAAYIDQIGNAIGSATSRGGMLSALLDIQYAAVANLPQEEAGIIVATVSVAISSMEYWEVNLESWYGLPGIAVAYATSSSSMIPIASQASGLGWPVRWSNPFVQNFIKVVGADALGAGRVLYTTWRMGPIGWDAAAAAGLYSSITTALALIF